jgi:hypothetical protein
MIDGALSHEMSEIDIQDALSDATGSALEQTPDPARPTVEPFLGKGSAVQRLNTVKAHIHKVSRQVFGIRSPCCRVGNHERNATFTHSFFKARTCEIGVPDLDRVSETVPTADG